MLRKMILQGLAAAIMVAVGAALYAGTAGPAGAAAVEAKRFVEAAIAGETILAQAGSGNGYMAAPPRSDRRGDRDRRDDVGRVAGSNGYMGRGGDRYDDDDDDDDRRYRSRNRDRNRDDDHDDDDD